MQLCPLPQTPDKGLKEIGYVHPLSGNGMSAITQVAMLGLDSGDNIPFNVPEDSLVMAYVEVPNDVNVVLSITNTGGMRKAVA